MPEEPIIVRSLREIVGRELLKRFFASLRMTSGGIQDDKNWRILASNFTDFRPNSCLRGVN